MTTIAEGQGLWVAAVIGYTVIAVLTAAAASAAATRRPPATMPGPDRHILLCGVGGPRAAHARGGWMRSGRASLDIIIEGRRRNVYS